MLNRITGRTESHHARYIQTVSDRQAGGHFIVRNRLPRFKVCTSDMNARRNRSLVLKRMTGFQGRSTR